MVWGYFQELLQWCSPAVDSLWDWGLLHFVGWVVLPLIVFWTLMLYAVRSLLPSRSRLRGIFYSRMGGQPTLERVLSTGTHGWGAEARKWDGEYGNSRTFWRMRWDNISLYIYSPRASLIHWVGKGLGCSFQTFSVLLCIELGVMYSVSQVEVYSGETGNLRFVFLTF